MRYFLFENCLHEVVLKKKNNGSIINAYFQTFLKFHHSICRKCVTTPTWRNKFKLETSEILSLLSSHWNTLSRSHHLSFMIKLSEVRSNKLSNSETFCFDAFLGCYRSKANSSQIVKSAGLRIRERWKAERSTDQKQRRLLRFNGISKFNSELVDSTSTSNLSSVKSQQLGLSELIAVGVSLP